jgi:hypothetical protein
VALGGLAVLAVLVLHLCAWFFLMLDRPDGGFHRTTVWTVLFFAPEVVLVLGVGAAAAVPRPGGRIFGAFWIGSVAAGVSCLLVRLPSRAGWSLPVVPPFGGGSR